MKIFVLTLNWNGEHHLRKLASGLKDNLEYSAIDYKWFIKDNASKDNSVSFLESLPYVDITRCNHNNDSFAIGVNVLLQRAVELGATDNDYILLLNNDLQFDDFAFSQSSNCNL
jgi:GT2 family glycosyltransferase